MCTAVTQKMQIEIDGTLPSCKGLEKVLSDISTQNTFSTVAFKNFLPASDETFL